jgi:hypothetical protein
MFGHQQLKVSERKNNPLAERTIVRAPTVLFPEPALDLRDEEQLACGPPGG